MSAQSELNKKLEFESRLLTSITRFHTRLVRAFVQQFLRTNTVLDANRLEDQLLKILSRHYHTTANFFSDSLPVTKVPSEITQIEQALTSFIAQQALDTTRLLNKTSNKDIVSSLEEAADDANVRLQVGTERQRLLARMAGLNLDRKLRGRAPNIALSETQMMAETAKATAAEVLSGLVPSIAGGTPQGTPSMKEWVSMGDSRSRTHHLAADGTRVPVSGVFIVAGERLRWPGDRSLGATGRNVARCRCTVNYEINRG